MTLMLASVSSPQEAEIAIAHGADIIDVRDPDAAFVGVPTDVARAIVDSVAGRRPVSAVADETPGAMADVGAAYIEVALARDANVAACLGELAPLGRRVKLLGVVFADERFDQETISLIAEAGFAGVLLHTPRREPRGLLDVMDIPALAAFIEAARAKGLLAGFAGAL